jgi:hypothetical protein
MKPSQLFFGIAAAGVQIAAAATPPGSEPQVPNTLGLAFEKNIVQPGELIDQAGKHLSSSHHSIQPKDERLTNTLPQSPTQHNQPSTAHTQKSTIAG